MLGIFSKTRIVSRNGIQFQVPLSNFSSFRYLVHPDGTGTGWTNVEAVDVNQPHGLDYRYSQHIAKGVRKRNDKEHKAFGDTTAGGEHKPGGCAILDIVDQTIDISIDDDTYKGRNLIYDQTGSSLWCFTNTDGTTSTPDGYRLMWGPKSICSGGDYTWTEAHEFDASIDISGNVAIDGDFSVDGTALFDSTGVEFGGTEGIGLFYDPTAYGGGETTTIGNGLIIKMGKQNMTTGQTITFGAAFPTAIVGVSLTMEHDAAAFPARASATTPPIKTGIKVEHGGVGATDIWWIAIGY